MVTTLISQPAIGRARSVELVAPASASTCVASLPATAVSPATASFHAVTTTTNMWLDGAVQGSGSGSKYAIKRIPPGRLRTET